MYQIIGEVLSLQMEIFENTNSPICNLATGTMATHCYRKSSRQWQITMIFVHLQLDTYL